MILKPGQYALRHRLVSPFEAKDDAKKEAVAYSNYLRWATTQFKGDWAKKIPRYGQAQAIALKIVDSLGLPKLDDDLLNNLEAFLDLGPWDEPGEEISLAGLWEACDWNTW